MTAQISNTFKIGDKEYEIIGISEDFNFDPRDFGLHPQAPHTALWRGYYYDANIIDEKLVVQNLYIHTGDEIYPPICDIEADTGDDVAPLGAYYDINIPLDFTGKILLGHKFIKSYYIHMGFQRPFAFEELLILTFENGNLVEEEDLSEKAAEARKEIDEDPEAFIANMKENLLGYIEDSFSLKIDDNWL